MTNYIRVQQLVNNLLGTKSVYPIWNNSELSIYLMPNGNELDIKNVLYCYVIRTFCLNSRYTSTVHDFIVKLTVSGFVKNF